MNGDSNLRALDETRDRPGCGRVWVRWQRGEPTSVLLTELSGREFLSVPLHHLATMLLSLSFTRTVYS